MGKRSSFERRPQDFYETPPAAVLPLLPHLDAGTAFVEPCAGAGALVRALEAHGHICVGAYDIEPKAPDVVQWDVLKQPVRVLSPGKIFCTNPPWTRSILHPLIERLSDILPTWLLFDSDWVHTLQAVPYLPRLRKIVAVGRVKWIADSKFTGKDNAQWHLFSTPATLSGTLFYGRTT